MGQRLTSYKKVVLLLQINQIEIPHTHKCTHKNRNNFCVISTMFRFELLQPVCCQIASKTVKLKCYFFDHLQLTTRLGQKKASGDHTPAFFFLPKPVSRTIFFRFFQVFKLGRGQKMTHNYKFQSATLYLKNCKSYQDIQYTGVK